MLNQTCAAHTDLVLKARPLRSLFFVAQKSAGEK